MQFERSKVMPINTHAIEDIYVSISDFKVASRHCWPVENSQDNSQ